MLAGLQVPSNGEILIDGDPLVSHRNEVTMVFQQAALFPWRTAEGNVRFALESRKLSQKAGKEISLQYLKLFGLENRSEHYPQQLSGGQEQRVALARALAYGPRVLLMDEPFAALDSQTRENLQEELSALLKERAITAVFVTHDIREAVFLADRVVVVSKHGGQILAQHKIESSQPRKESFRYTSEFSEARLKLWNLLKDATNEQIA